MDHFRRIVETSAEIILVTSLICFHAIRQAAIAFSPSITRIIIIQNRVIVAEMICHFIREPCYCFRLNIVFSSFKPVIDTDRTRMKRVKHAKQ